MCQPYMAWCEMQEKQQYLNSAYENNGFRKGWQIALLIASFSPTTVAKEKKN